MNPTPEIIESYDLMAEEPIRHFYPEVKERLKQILGIADRLNTLKHIWKIDRIGIIATQFNIHEFRFWLDMNSKTDAEAFLVYGSVPAYTPVWRINLQHDGDKWMLVKE